jgi:hypothetical protein
MRSARAKLAAPAQSELRETISAQRCAGPTQTNATIRLVACWPQMNLEDFYDVRAHALWVRATVWVAPPQWGYIDASHVSPAACGRGLAR